MTNARMGTAQRTVVALCRWETSGRYDDRLVDVPVSGQRGWIVGEGSDESQVMAGIRGDIRPDLHPLVVSAHIGGSELRAPGPCTTLGVPQAQHQLRSLTTYVADLDPKPNVVAGRRKHRGDVKAVVHEGFRLTPAGQLGGEASVR